MNGSPHMSNDRLMVFKRFVLDLTTLSKCTDKQVACIITDAAGSQVYSIGINGGAKGGPDCLCQLDGTRYTCVHAEANALAKCTTHDDNKVVVSSFGPCVTCAALMVNSGIKQFYYMSDYKSEAGLKILRDAGVYCRNISDEQAQKDWVDKLIDVLHCCGFVNITRASALGRWNTEAKDRVVEAGEKLGYETHITTQTTGLLLEWREKTNG